MPYDAQRSARIAVPARAAFNGSVQPQRGSALLFSLVILTTITLVASLTLQETTVPIEAMPASLWRRLDRANNFRCSTQWTLWSACTPCHWRDRTRCLAT